MRLVTVRLESNLKKIVDIYSEAYNVNKSDVIRDLIRIGLGFEKDVTRVEGPFGIVVPTSGIDLGGETERLTFYVEEDLLGQAQAFFNDDDISVLRLALRRAVLNIIPFRLTQSDLHDFPAEYHGYGDNLNNINLILTTVITDEFKQEILRKLAPFLDPENESPVHIVTGAYGSGKTHLIRYTSAIAGNSKLLDFVNDEELKASMSRFSGKYEVLNIEDSLTSPEDTYQEKIQRIHFKKGYEQTRSKESEDIDKSEEKTIKRYPGKQLLIVGQINSNLDMERLTSFLLKLNDFTDIFGQANWSKTPKLLLESNQTTTIRTGSQIKQEIGESKLKTKT